MGSMLLPLLLPSSSEVAVVGEGVVVRAEVEVEEEANDDDDDDNDDIFGGKDFRNWEGERASFSSRLTSYGRTLQIRIKRIDPSDEAGKQLKNKMFFYRSIVEGASSKDVSSITSISSSKKRKKHSPFGAPLSHRR